MLGDNPELRKTLERAARVAERAEVDAGYITPPAAIQGNGEIYIAEANVRAAIEHWLNSQVLRAPITVTGVTFHPSLKTYAITFGPGKG